MAERFTKKEFWDEAGKGGLVLGLIPVACMAIDQLLLQSAEGTIPAIIGFLVWAAKFVGCILLMRFFMRRFADRHDGVTRQDASRFGTAIALTSALIYSAFVLAWSQFIDPEMFSRSFEAVAQQYASMMDSNAMDALEKIQGKMPVIAFFSTLIYCFLYGSILAGILAGRIGKDVDPFSDGKNPFSNDNR